MTTKIMAAERDLEGCFALAVSGLLNDVTFHMAKCCAEVNTSKITE